MKIKSSKATRLHQILLEAVKAVITIILKTVLNFFNTLLSTHKYPKEWIVTNIILTWKGNHVFQDDLLNTLRTLFERLIKQRIKKELESKEGLSDWQYRFGIGQSTMQAIERVTNSKKKWVLLVANAEVVPVKHLRYLRVYLDEKVFLTEHNRQTIKKEETKIARPTRILPNIRVVPIERWCVARYTP